MVKLTSDADERGRNEQWQLPTGMQPFGQSIMFGSPSANAFPGPQTSSASTTGRQDSPSDMIQPFAATFVITPQPFNQLVQMRQVPSSSNLTASTITNGSSLGNHGFATRDFPIQPHMTSNGIGYGTVINLLGQVIGDDIADDDIQIVTPRHSNGSHPSIAQNDVTTAAQGVANIGLDCTSPSTDSTRRSDLVSFFAAMRAPSQSTTVFAISRGSMSNYPTSSSVPVASTSSLRRRDAPAFIKSTLPPAAVSVALPQDQPNGKILKRPNDLLLHMLRGRTVFETSNGQMFTAEHIAYINAYYSGEKEAADLNEILAEPSSPESVPNRENLTTNQQDKCQLCQSQDLPVLPRGNSKLCTQCLNADLELPAPPAKPVLPSSKQSTPSLSPKGARKSVLDSVLSRTAVSDSRPGNSKSFVASSEKSSKSPNRDASSQILHLRPTITPSLTLSKPSRLPSTSNTSEKSKLSEESSTRNPHLPLVTGFDSFRAHAFITVLLRQKPEIGQWLVSDVGIFLRSLRGLEKFAQKFIDGEVDGHALCLLDADNMVKDMGMSKCMAYKTLHMVKLLQGKPFHMEQVLYLL